MESSWNPPRTIRFVSSPLRFHCLRRILLQLCIRLAGLQGVSKWCWDIIPKPLILLDTMGNFRQGDWLNSHGLLALVQIDHRTTNTVYTDNTIAASILTNFKCPRPP
eukprot:5072545-Pleurochrysis_carterae.AAC.1